MSGHRSADTPVVAVLCDNPAHGDEPFVVARFAKPPAGTWIAFGTVTGQDWLPLPVFYDAAVNPRRQHLRRTEDLDSGGRYGLECRKCAPHKGRRVTVPIRQGLLNTVCDGLRAAGVSTVTLSALAATVGR